MTNSTDVSSLHLLGTFGFVIFILALVQYIFSSLAYMSMARNAGISNPWLAWIPFANLWIIGGLVSDELRGNGGLKYLLIGVGGLIFSFIPVVGQIIGFAIGIFTIAVMYWIYRKYSYKPILHTILSVIIPLYLPIALFVIRNNEAK